MIPESADPDDCVSKSRKYDHVGSESAEPLRADLMEALQF